MHKIVNKQTGLIEFKGNDRELIEYARSLLPFRSDWSIIGISDALEYIQEVWYDTLEVSEFHASKTEVQEFEQLTRPLIKYLCDNHCPYTKIIITPTGAGMLVGKMGTGEIMDYIKD